MKTSIGMSVAALWMLALPLHADAADLYSPEHYRALASDVKAMRVGDSLTVQVTENASATTTADTSADRETTAAAVIRTRSQAPILEGSEKHDFSGNAKTQRAGKLLAQITVTVTAVQPNGDLQIAGQQLVEINDEKQLIKLEGRVRRQDISDGNTVASSRIADAVIQYVGDGVLTNAQRVGLVTRILTWLGL